ncbi:TonB-dependent receptor [Spongiibacter taiwanensis]|uniref:TonB-dependent receptor n=1 Tax=Spongiibacter taiwanensis TaxID=1748242 RepID=UPI0020362162|nr:TonB-dependent receptor [Spongiibacter taiwanensis]USA43969.1 TonB-dependent receptor [Spongiibacter taiwanensis]
MRKILALEVVAVLFPVALNAAQLEEVVVTAQKRSQSINDVGLSVSAATSEQIADAGISDTGDLIKVSPGLVFTASQNGTPLFSLRGVGFNDYTLGASPAVSVYVDEVPLAYGAFTKGATLDLERVEVLKGPQGLLFGQNSTGGAINYIAAKPTREFEAGGRLSVGRFNRVEADAYASGPLGDVVAGRVALATTQADEWQESISSNRELGAEDTFKGRAQLQIDATDRTSVLVGINGWTDQSDTQAAQLQGLQLQYASPADAPVADVAATQQRIDAFFTQPNAGNNARSAEWDEGRDLSRDDSFTQVTLRIDHELGDNLMFTSITAASEYEEDYAMDRDGTTLQNMGIDSVGSVDSFTQELRISGSSDSNQWLVGVNYATNDVESDETVLVADSTNVALQPGGPFIQNATTSITQDIEDIGVFANLEQDLSEQLTLLVGARYTESTNDFTACSRSTDPGLNSTFAFFSDVLRGQLPGTTVLAPGDCVSLDPLTAENSRTPYEDSLEEDNVSWRVGLNYRVNEDLLLYTLASKGYKTGSYPILPASTTAQFEPVTQESVQALEAGFKWSLADRRAQLNSAVFYYEYDDKQVRGSVKDPVYNQLDRLVNIPESTIQGFELELTFTPIEGLMLRASGTYVETEVKEWYTFVNPATGMEEDGLNGVREQGDFSGSDLPFTPELHFVADVDYRWPLNDTLGAFIGANLLYNSEANSTFGDPKATRIDGFTTLDIRLGLESLDGTWTATLWGRNVTDEYYWSNQFVTQDVVVRYAAKPVTYGLTFAYHFM